VNVSASLIYFGYRFYNPDTARWLTRDPIEEDGGLNLYEYCGNEPVDHVDALGLSILDYLECVGNCIGDTNKELKALAANALSCASAACMSIPIPKDSCNAGQKPCQSAVRTLNEWLFKKGINTGKWGARLCKLGGRAVPSVIIAEGGIQLGIEVYCAKQCWGSK
jgi:hypothetical protein